MRGTRQAGPVIPDVRAALRGPTRGLAREPRTRTPVLLSEMIRPVTDATGAARLAGHLAATADIAAALDSGEAITVPGTRDTIIRAGTWLEPACAGWRPVTGPAAFTTRYRPEPPAPQDTEGIPDPWQP